jgi:hypothetical protein
MVSNREEPSPSLHSHQTEIGAVGLRANYQLEGEKHECLPEASSPCIQVGPSFIAMAAMVIDSRFGGGVHVRRGRRGSRR